MKQKLTLRERVLLHFAFNPGEKLSTTEIMEIFDVAHAKTVGRLLIGAIEQALLNKTWKPGQTAVFSAGPALLAAVDKSRPVVID